TELPSLSVVHQCGADSRTDLERRYDSLGMGHRARVVPFIDDVAGALAEADLVVGRAGASAIAELCAVGRPSILIPFPFAADDHQRKNAESLAAAGASVCIVQRELTIERLAAEIVRLANDPDQRASMATVARERGAPDAAARVARDLLALAG